MTFDAYLMLLQVMVACSRDEREAYAMDIVWEREQHSRAIQAKIKAGMLALRAARR